jgi:hypothetical protein
MNSVSKPPILSHNLTAARPPNDPTVGRHRQTRSSAKDRFGTKVLSSATKAVHHCESAAAPIRSPISPRPSSGRPQGRSRSSPIFTKDLSIATSVFEQRQFAALSDLAAALSCAIVIGQRRLCFEPKPPSNRTTAPAHARPILPGRSLFGGLRRGRQCPTPAKFKLPRSGTRRKKEELGRRRRGPGTEYGGGDR